MFCGSCCKYFSWTEIKLIKQNAEPIQKTFAATSYSITCTSYNVAKECLLELYDLYYIYELFVHDLFLVFSEKNLHALFIVLLTWIDITGAVKLYQK